MIHANDYINCDGVREMSRDDAINHLVTKNNILKLSNKIVSNHVITPSGELIEAYKNSVIDHYEDFPFLSGILDDSDIESYINYHEMYEDGSFDYESTDYPEQIDEMRYFEVFQHFVITHDLMETIHKNGLNFMNTCGKFFGIPIYARGAYGIALQNDFNTLAESLLKQAAIDFCNE